MAAYLKARIYDPQGRTCGVACTASLASDRPKRGAHRVHLAYQTATTTASLSVELEKGRRSRAEEEDITAALLLNLIAAASAVEGRLEVPLTEAERLRSEQIVASEELQQLLAGQVRLVRLGNTDSGETPPAIFSGAFDPLHDGHRKMAETAGRWLGCAVDFELSILNVDKPPLDFMAIDRRARQFSAGQTLWLTRRRSVH